MAGDLRVPVGRVRVGVRAGQHLPRDHPVRVGPRLVVLDAPLFPGEGAHGFDQRSAHDVVVLRLHVKLAVITAQCTQVLVELLRIPQGLHRRDDRPQQAGPLHVHLHREQIPQIWVRQEDAGVEVTRNLVLLLLDEAPALLQHPCKVTH
jgi:hypothetical protein